ncbi:MAG: hypothetical protein LBM60_01145 [Clostridium sp.]|nr:hypothetical protein [Clostridium sp.]
MSLKPNNTDGSNETFPIPKRSHDLHLNGLRLRKKRARIILWISISTLVITLAFYAHAVIVTPNLYEAKSTYYIEYASDPKVVDGKYTYINYYTWDMWVRTQRFLELIEAFLLESNKQASEPLTQIPSRDEIKNALSADVPSDLRVVQTMVRMANPKDALSVAAALEKAVVAFGLEQREIESVRIDDHAIVASPMQTNFDWISMILSVGLLATIFFLSAFYIQEVLSDAIWLPRTIRLRFGLQAAGSIYEPCFQCNMKDFLSPYERVGLTHITRCAKTKPIKSNNSMDENDYNLELIRDCVDDPMTQKWEMVPPILEEPEAINRLKEMDAIVLLIDAGAHMGQRVLCALEFLHYHKCHVAATILWDADDDLINEYYRTPWDCFT